MRFADVVFAGYAYHAEPVRAMLDTWRSIVRATADWMTAYVWRNATMSVFDLGPPMYVVIEDAGPNVTCNLGFELAYWRLGLEHAGVWMERRPRSEEVPEACTEVRNNLTPLPVKDGLYAVYEGIPNDF